MAINTNCDPDNVNSQADGLSLDESRELLEEVRRATASTGQDELHEFTCLLCQIVELHQQQGDQSASGAAPHGEGAIEFIAKSLDEIRSVFGSDEATSPCMTELRTQGIDRWGDQLTSGAGDPFDDGGPFDCSDPFDASQESGMRWAQSGDEEPFFDADADVVAPSAAEISSMMNQFASLSDSALDQAAADPSTPIAVGKIVPESDDGPAANGKSASESIDSLDPELREAFLDDAAGCVSSMENALLRLESEPKNGESLNQICRELHTLKGASASVGLTDLADQLHRMEDSIHDGQSAGKPPAVDALLSSVDSIRSQIIGNDGGSHEAVQQPLPAASAATGSPPARASSPPANAFAEGPADDESVRVQSSQLNRLMDMLAELVMLRNRRETELSELQEVYHELIGSVSKMRLLNSEGHSQAPESKSLQISEIANDVLEVAQHVRDCARPVAEGNTAVSQFIRQFRQELVELRRTPVSGLFRRLQRVVRDAAVAESKQVRLKLLGEDAGIERSLQQRLYEPLLHIVRNSVCHGIETKEERLQSGKDPVGTITLEAKSGPDLFVIEIRDDGKGLDYDAIRRRGVESGLITTDQAATHAELSQLIFHPGFSTRETTSQVAGRGVGMDVVASTLQRMRGWLEVESQPREGTRVRLSFPLPSVIQHAMVFRSGKQLFALPMQSVQNAGEVDVDKGSVCLDFLDILGSPSVDRESECQRIVLACKSPDVSGAGRGSVRVTLLVDEIVGPEEVVVRPLPTLLKHHPFCSGATLSGMGQTVLFLDARRLVETQSQSLHPPGSATRQKIVAAKATEIDASQSVWPRVLVVDDSLSARKRVVRSLQRYPIDVVEASDGKEALKLLKTERFVSVFSDMEMPHVNGLELLQEIQAAEQPDSPPVVFISSRGEDEFTIRARDLGANNYLIKPLSDDALDGALAGIPILQNLTPNAPTLPQPSGTF